MRKLSQDRCRVLTVCPPGRNRPALWDKLRFATHAAASQLSGEFEWLFYDHVGPASVQSFVPSRYRRPYGVFLHGIEVWDQMTAAGKRTLAAATVRVANSNYTAERVAREHPGLGPISVCPLALLPEAPVVAKQGNMDTGLLQRIREKSVLIVGRMSALERYKGHLELIRAWPIITQQIPGAQLIVVGTGDDLEFLQATAREAGLAGDILFTGWVNEETLDAVYEHAAVFAMPSRGEGFGLVFLEAMKHRLPCIASTADASGEVVADGETGFLVDPSDQPMLAARIVTTLEDSSLRSRMGEAGEQRLHRQFSFPQFEQNFVAAIQPLIQAGQL